LPKLSFSDGLDMVRSLQVRGNFAAFGVFAVWWQVKPRADASHGELTR
jgi:hypothetical protein